MKKIDGSELPLNCGYRQGFIPPDSRSFTSYPRHEYFRRILCGLIGEWAEDGMYPCSTESLAQIVADICYNNTKNFFGFHAIHTKASGN